MVMNRSISFGDVFDARDWLEEVVEELDCGREVTAVYAKVCRRQGRYERGRLDKGRHAAAFAREPARVCHSGSSKAMSTDSITTDHILPNRIGNHTGNMDKKSTIPSFLETDFSFATGAGRGT